MQLKTDTARSFLYFFLLVFLLLGCDQEEKNKPLQLGDTAPDFAVKDLKGNVIVLSNQQGRPVILRFFETNCRFCRADTPAFTQFYAAHKDKGLQIIYIGSFYEKEHDLQTFVKELGLVFPVVQDKQAQLADLYGIRAYPQTVFIGPDQKILAALLGGVGAAELREIFGY